MFDANVVMDQVCMHGSREEVCFWFWFGVLLLIAHLGIAGKVGGMIGVFARLFAHQVTLIP